MKLCRSSEKCFWFHKTKRNATRQVYAWLWKLSLSDFHREASARGVTQSPGVWERGQKIIKLKKKYVWDLRCSLECCWRFGQVLWHVTPCLIFPDVSKGSAFEMALCWLHLMHRIPTLFILRGGEGLKDERLQSWSEGTPEFRNNCHRDVMSSVPGPCGLDVQQATTREGR